MCANPTVTLLKHLMTDETEAVYSEFDGWHVNGTLGITRNTLPSIEYCAAIGSKVIQ